MASQISINIGLNNGISFVRRQAIISANADLLTIATIRTNVNAIKSCKTTPTFNEMNSNILKSGFNVLNGDLLICKLSISYVAIPACSLSQHKGC